MIVEIPVATRAYMCLFWGPLSNLRATILSTNVTSFQPTNHELTMHASKLAIIINLFLRRNQTASVGIKEKPQKLYEVTIKGTLCVLNNQYDSTCEKKTGLICYNQNAQFTWNNQRGCLWNNQRLYLLNNNQRGLICMKTQLGAICIKSRGLICLYKAMITGALPVWNHQRLICKKRKNNQRLNEYERHQRGSNYEPIFLEELKFTFL